MLYFQFNTLGVTTCTTSERIKSPSQSWEVNKVNSFKFAIHLSDPASKYIYKQITYVKIYDDQDTSTSDGIIFEGRVFSVSKSSDGFAKVTCEGPLGYLRDAVYRGQDIKNSYAGSSQYYGTHIMTILSSMMYDYQNFVDDKRAYVGYVNFVGRGSADSNWKDGYIKEDFELQGLNDYEVLYKLIEALDWEFQITKTTQANKKVWLLSISQFFGYQCTTPITTSFNLKSASVSSGDGDDGFYTSIFPLGGYGYDEKRLSLKTMAAGTPLDNRTEWNIDTTPGNTVGLDGTMMSALVDNKKLVKKYGRIIKAITYDDIVANSASDVITQRQRLYAIAEKQAKMLSEPKLDIDISVYDLKEAGFPVDKLKVSNIYEVIDPITDTHVYARLTAMTKYYDKPLEPDTTFTYYNYDKAGEVR